MSEDVSRAPSDDSVTRRERRSDYREQVLGVPVGLRRDSGEGATGFDDLLDPGNAVTPDELLRAGSEGLATPGLYTWWVDEAGAADLTRGMGHHVAPGLLYVGKAGGHRQNAAPSSATLWSRVAGGHLRGNVNSSTLRLSLAAVLRASVWPRTRTR